MKPYYETSLGKLYCGDCLEIMPELEPVDLVLTDPPYGLNFSYDLYVDSRENLENIIINLFRVIPQTTNNLAILCGPTQITLYPRPDWALCVVWNTTGSFGKYGYNQWTPILCYGKDIKGFGNINGVLKSDVLKISGGSGVGFMRSKEEKLHVCPKPLNMMELIIRRLSNAQNIILDPFLGSGTTAVACERLNRKWIGIEISEKYCEIAAKRIEREAKQLKLWR